MSKPPIRSETEARALFDANLDIAENIALWYAGRTRFRVELNELRSFAFVGLLDAARRYQPKNEDSRFEWFARLRVRGAIKDGLRSLGWWQRRGRHNREALNTRPEFGDGYLLAADPGPLPDRQLELAEREHRLAWAIGELPAPECAVMRGILAGVTCEQMARERGVSAARISQIKRNAVARLREILDGNSNLLGSGGASRWPRSGPVHLLAHRAGRCVQRAQAWKGHAMTDVTKGLDLSHHQSPAAVPWERIGAECAFVICRATYGTMRDRQVAEHMRRARAAGVQVGLYHFFRSVQRLDDQLAAFSAAAEAAGYQPGDIVPAIDVEDDPKVADVSPTWAPQVHAFALALEERYGGVPLIYITQRDWHRAGKPLWMLEHPLWIAHYTQAPKPATPANAQWLIWQNRVGPFDPSGPGGLHQPALFDHNLCCGRLPVTGKVSAGATAPVVETASASADPSWEELRHRVETSQALWFDSQIHPEDPESNT